MITAIILFAVASIGILTSSFIGTVGIIEEKLTLLLFSVFIFMVAVALCFLIKFLPKKLKWLKIGLGVLVFWILAFGAVPMLIDVVFGNGSFETAGKLI